MQFGAQCLVVVGVSLMLGCGKTAYQPAKSARVAATSEGYVRDGITYPSGLGGGLVEALHDSPRAQQQARSSRSFLIGGVVCGFGGIAVEGLGLGLMVAGTRTNEETGRGEATTLGKVGAGVALGGIVSAVVGIVLLTHASARAVDAVNIHNDSVDSEPARARTP